MKESPRSRFVSDQRKRKIPLISPLTEPQPVAATARPSRRRPSSSRRPPPPLVPAVVPSSSSRASSSGRPPPQLTHRPIDARPAGAPARPDDRRRSSLTTPSLLVPLAPQLAPSLLVPPRRQSSSCRAAAASRPAAARSRGAGAAVSTCDQTIELATDRLS